MSASETLNRWAAAWANVMGSGLIDATLLLAIVGCLWLMLRRRMPAQVGYCLFLLVLVKLLVPLPITAPSWLALTSPRNAASALIAWVTAPASPVVGVAEMPLAMPSGAAHRSGEVFDRLAELGRDEGDSWVADRPPIPVVTRAVPLTLSVKLMLGWLSVVAALLLRFALAQWRMLRLIRQATPLNPASLTVDFDELRSLAGIRRPVHLVASPALGVPAVSGLLRPRLVLPPDLAERLTPNQLSWVLLHELAHIRRADLLVALVQRLVQIVYFFHPAVWLANWLIDQQREYACDDAALAACHFPRRDCGQGFLRIVELASAEPVTVAPALGLFDGALSYKLFIRSRLMRILDTRRPVQPRLTLSSVVLLVLLAILLIPQLRGQQKAIIPQTTNSTAADPPAQAAPASAAVNPVVREIPWPYREGGGYNQVLSPDGKKLALNGPFTKGTGVQPDISILDLATNRETTIVRPDLNSSVWIPRWSPLGGQIAYTAWHYDLFAGKGVHELRIIPASGGEPRTVMRRDENFFAVDWSRDGKWILAGVGTNGSYSLWSIPVEGGGARELVSFGVIGNAPYGTIAPSGDMIAFERSRNGKLQLVVIEVATLREVAIETDLEPSQNKNGGRPVWSLDGRHLLFMGSPGDGPHLYAQRIKDRAPAGSPVLIKRDGGGDYWPIVLSDGRLLYSTVVRAPLQLFAASIDSQTGKLQGKPVLVKDRLELDKSSDIILSPDGQWLAGRAQKKGTADYELCVTRADGSQPRHITTQIQGVRICGWFPDGKSLLVHGSTEGMGAKNAHFRVAVESGAIELVLSPHDAGPGRLSPDGRRQALGIASDLYVREMRAGAEPTLLRSVPQDSSGPPSWSPDGRSIAFYSTDKRDRSKRQLCLISVEGGEVSELAPATRIKPTNDFVAWSPDGKFLAYNHERPGGGSGIWLIRPEGGEPIYLDVGVKYVFSHTFTADGKSLLFTGANDDDKSHMWSLENYLPIE